MFKRVFVGRFFHESHGFNPHPATADQFEVECDATLAASTRSSGTTLGGIVRKFDELGYELLFGLSLTAPPSGLVEHGFFEAMRNELVALARDARCDAIALELHGAMGTTETPDGDGDLLAHLRAAVGSEILIGVGLDLHAHITPAMLANTDVCIACKENPHSDVVQCGERVAVLLDEILHGVLKPVTVMAKTRMILPGAGETADGPLGAVHAQAREIARKEPAIRDISLYNVFRYCDDEDMGQAAVVLADGDAAVAERAASGLAEEFWAKREEFRDDLLSIDDALDVIVRDPHRRPYVFADMGDRVLAGAPGDSTAVLRRLLERGLPLRAAFPVTDPEGVAVAAAAGPGATLRLAVGGRLTPGFTPFDVEAVVVGTSDGIFQMRGPYRAGERTSLGPSATLLIDGRISVLLTTKPGFTHDPAAFESQGIAAAEQDFLVVKSGYHFKLNFEGTATPLLVATPGIGYYTKGLLPWRRGRFWPEHDVAAAPIVPAQVFTRDGVAKF
jgi:microcystin degradation protein MlrC